jgi:signal transduction histidine kinase
MRRSNGGPATSGAALGTLYLWMVAIVSIAILAYLAQVGQPVAAHLGLATELVFLGAFAQHFPLQYGPQRKADPSIAVYFACVLLFDPQAAVVMVGTSQLLGQTTLALRRAPGTGQRMRGARGVLFNTSQLVLATALGSLVYYLLVSPPRSPTTLDRPENLWAVPAAAVVMHVTSSLAVALMVGLQVRHSVREVWLSDWRNRVLERAGLFLIGLIAALAAGQYAWAPLVTALLAAILFLAQRRALGLLAAEQFARSEAERTQSYLSLLAGSGAVLASSLDYEATLHGAVRLPVPAFADSCAISIDREDHARRRLAVAHIDPVQEARLRELLLRSPSVMRPKDPARSELYPVVSESNLAAWAGDTDSLWLPRELGPGSAILVPLVARGETLGSMALYTVLSGRRYGTSDLTVAEDLAHRIAVALDNACLYEEQQRIVGRLQHLRGQLEATERAKLLSDERDRIARELHDRVEQTFYSIGLIVSALLAGPAATITESANASLAQVRSSARQGAEELRAAIFALTRAEVHDRELVGALWQLVREFQERTGLEVDLVESGVERRAAPEIAEVLHAVAREGLANVDQHARASAAVVSLRVESDVATLTVQDDGVGASALVLRTLAHSATRFGLRDIRERVLRLGGTFTAEAGDEGGFVVRARVPLRGPGAR